MTNTPSDSEPPHRLLIGLNAVVAGIDQDHPKVLIVNRDRAGLPYGTFSPRRHRTFEIGLRDFVKTQTNMSLGYVEQLYTFGDKGREAPSAVLVGGNEDDRIISVGYLALTQTLMPIERSDTAWRDWYDFFPWEDWRNGAPKLLIETLLPALKHWANEGKTTELDDSRTARINSCFGLEQTSWAEERVLERYELMFEAGLVKEAGSDLETGKIMSSDHRRILATAIGRLRGKLRYRPVIFDMMPPTFTLLELQRTVEAILGFSLHKQNFRRGVENAGLVENTGQMSHQAAGRPAALFRRAAGNTTDRVLQGLTLPRARLQKDNT